MKSEQEIYDEMTAWAEELGPRAHVSISMDARKGRANRWFLYAKPDGITNDNITIIAHGPSMEAALAAGKAKYAEVAADRESRQVRKMALAVIRLTDELGSCTDAALRQDGFHQSEIDKIGKAACERADEMAGRGPFEIAHSGAANQAAE